MLCPHGLAHPGPFAPANLHHREPSVQDGTRLKDLNAQANQACLKWGGGNCKGANPPFKYKVVLTCASRARLLGQAPLARAGAGAGQASTCTFACT